MATITSDPSNTPSNWTDTDAWVGGAVPLSTDDVVITGAHVITLTAETICASLTTTAFSGTLVQSTQILTVNGDIAWAAGTFTGNDAAITAETFTLTGSAVWDSTSGEFLLSKGSTYGHTFMTVTGTGFGHRSGTVKLVQTTGWVVTNTWNITAAIAFNNLTIASGSTTGGTYSTTLNLTGGVNPTVAGSLVIDTTGLNYLYMNGGTIECSGDLSCVHEKMSGGTTVIKLTGTVAKTYTWSAGVFPHIEVAYGVGGSITAHPTLPAPSGTTGLAASFFTMTSGEFTAPSGEFLITFYQIYTGLTFITVTDGTFTHNSGTVKVVHSRAWSNTTAYWVVNSAIAFNNLTIGGGNVISSRTHYLDLSGGVNPTVAGLLKIDTAGYYNLVMNGGTIECSGGISCVHGEMNGGTTVIELNGTDDNTYTWSAGVFPHLEVAYGVGGSIIAAELTTGLAASFFTMTSGEFTAPSGEFLITFYQIYTGLTFITVTDGTFTHNSGTVKVVHSRAWSNTTAYWVVNSAIAFNNLTIASGNVISSRTHYLDLSGSTNPTVEGSLVVDTTGLYNLVMNGGTIECAGNVSCLHSEMNGGTTAITLNGTDVQTITHSAGTMPGGTWTNSNTAGHVAQATAVTLGGALTTDTDSRWCQGVYDLAAGTTTNNGTIVKDNAGVSSPTIASGNAVEIGPCVAVPAPKGNKLFQSSPNFSMWQTGFRRRH